MTRYNDNEIVSMYLTKENVLGGKPIKEWVDVVTNNYRFRKVVVVRAVYYNVDNFDYLDGLKIITSTS